jgi:hypothetical protein
MRELPVLLREHGGDLVLLAPKLRILVGHDWWCQWWEAIPDS